MNDIKHLLAVADAYKAALQIDEDKTVSSRVFEDSKKLSAMRGGADITVGRYNAAMVWFSEHWPEGAEWPGGIARPFVEQAA
jgi:hypothetical protein